MAKKKREKRMPKSKACGVIEVGQGSLVDARTIGGHIGFTSKWVNSMAEAGKLPWVGVKNGAKVYRRFSIDAVMAALAHGVEASGEDDASPRRDVDSLPAQVQILRRRRGRPPKSATSKQ